MQIGLIIYGSLDSISGGYLYDRKLVEHLRASGARVEVLSLPARNYLRHLGDNFQHTLLAQIESLQLDLLLQDELNHPSLVLLNRRIKHRTHLPIISIVHHLRSSEHRPAWQNLLYRQVERAYLNSVDGFIYNSQTTRQVVEGLLAQAKPFTVARPAGDRFTSGLPEAEIVRRAQAEGPLRLLFAGSVIPRKCLHTLIDALASLPRQQFHLSIAGSTQADPPYTRRMQGMVQAAGLTEVVTFLGALQDEALAQQYRENQLLVLPSSYEGYGIVYLEGMGFGLPAIGTTSGAAREIIQHGQNGFLIQPAAAGELASLLAELHIDRRKLCQLSLAAWQRFLAHPSWQQSGEKIVKFVQEMGAT